ncbi:MAG: IclR family transcriptional regulator [Spirochaetota bacterium]
MKSLEKTFAIIELLKRERALRLQEIADELELYKSTAHRIVTELCSYNYLERDDETKKYRLGLKFVDISSHIIEHLDIRQAASKSIEELNKITKETVHLAMLFDNQAIYVDKQESPHTIRMYSQIGKIAPLYCTGVGKAILAFQPEETLNRLLNSIVFHKYTENTILSKERLKAEIEEIRKKGYALDMEEHEKSIICLAAPIRNHTKKVVASISVTAILPRMKMKDLLTYKNTILEKSYEISSKLGYKEKKYA